MILTVFSFIIYQSEFLWRDETIFEDATSFWKYIHSIVIGGAAAAIYALSKSSAIWKGVTILHFD